MGFQNWLSKVYNSVSDIFAAPIGLVINSAEAIGSDEINPGFFGVTGEAIEGIIGGLSGLGDAFGFGALGEDIGKSRLAPALSFLFNESERIYSSEFQVNTGLAPIGLRQLGVQPGEVSLQRLGATATGSTGAALNQALAFIPGIERGDPLDISYARQWQKAAFRTPGQAWIEDSVVPDFYQRSVEEQDEIRESAWYNLFSGTIDAATRWMTDPLVVTGKAYKVSRRRFWQFDPDRNNSRLLKQRPSGHKKSLRSMGYGMGDEIVGPNSLPMTTLKGGRNKEVYTVVRGKTINQLDGEGYRLVDDLDAPAALYSDDEIELVRNFARDNGVPEEQLEGFVDQVVRSQSADDLNLETAKKGILGNKAKSSTTPRYSGTQHRPLQLFGADSVDEARIYAAALYKADPTDMPVILKLDADGLPVVFEEFDLAVLPSARDYNPNDANFLTLAGDAVDHIDEVIRLDPSDLDQALNLDKSLSNLTPGGRLSGRLYHPDGTPIEPDMLANIEAIIKDVTTASKLSGNSVELEKFLEMRRLQRNTGPTKADTLAIRAADNKVVQAHLNWMDGKEMAEIRATLFPNTPFGDVVAGMLSDARTYQERRTIFLASMGYKTQNFTTLEPFIQIRLEKLLLEAERVSSGMAPNELVNTMLGLNTRAQKMAVPFIDDLVKELLSEVEDQAALTRFLDRISDMAPIRQIQFPRIGTGVNLIRRTSFYQQSSLTRPIRVVSENRPHQWINLNDPLSDKQVKRQMLEAQGLGFTPKQVADTQKRYAMADNEAAKEAVIASMNKQIIDKAAKVAKMTPKEFEKLLNESRAGTDQAKQFLASRRYASGKKDLFEWTDPETGEIFMVPQPVLSTQLASWIPIPNAREIVKQANKIGKLRARLPGAKVVDLLDEFYRIWKPSVLLRGGWMIRVVSDEQLRILAMMGSMLNHIAAISKGEVPKFSSVFAADLTWGQRAGATLATATGTQPITALTVRAAKGITSVADKLGLLNKQTMRHMDNAGLENLVSSRSTYGGPSEQTLRSLQTLIGRDEQVVLNHLYKKGIGEWKSITAGDPGFGTAWARVLTEQYGRDPLGRKLIQDILSRRLFDLDDINPGDMKALVISGKKFLRNTAEGREVAERMPWASRDPERWLTELIEEINSYTGGFDEDLLRGSLRHKVTDKMLESIDERVRPDIVHSEMVAQTLGTSATMEVLKDFTSEAFDLIGRLPTDTLSRQPLFKELYSKEMLRLERIRAQQGLVLNEDAIVRMDQSARQFAIATTKEYLYDLAEVSRFGYMVRHIAPFYPAWQEIYTVWGKLARQDPSIFGRAKLLWEAPNKAGMVYTDQDGEEFISFRLSEDAANNLKLSGWQKYIATGGIDFAKQSFNLILNNPLPGVGPPIQYPVNEIVKRKPELEEALKFLLPFGVTTSRTNIFLSPLVRQIASELKGREGDKSYERAFIDALTWMDVQYRRGERTTIPTPEEAHDIAGKLRIIRWATRLASPAQPIFRSPLQPFIDIYRDMQDTLGPEKAHEAFLNEVGMEFFAVTESRTASVTGIPPTVEAEVARRKYTELIQKYPEYGNLIIGDEALGEFSMAAFAAQLERPIDPDNPFSEVERAYRPQELDPRTGGIIEVDRKLGWGEYIQAMDVIDLERKRRGLPNLRVADASDLADAKEAVTQFIRAKYPSWWEDFNTRDDLKWGKRIEAFRAITKDTASQSRSDINTLATYLEGREIILQELNRRKMSGGSSTLDASANQDLAFLWDSTVTKLLEDNIAFGPLYYRYLEGDPVRLK